MNLRRAILAGGFAALVGGGWVVLWNIRTSEATREKLTLTRINNLGHALLTVMPRRIDTQTLLEVLGTRDESLLLDGWGEPIKVSVSENDQGMHYTIWSLSPRGRREGAGSDASVGDGPVKPHFLWRDGHWLRAFDHRSGQDRVWRDGRLLEEEQAKGRDLE